MKGKKSFVIPFEKDRNKKKKRRHRSRSMQHMLGNLAQMDELDYDDSKVSKNSQ